LIRAWFFEPNGLPGQQLPMAVLFVPDRQDAELHRVSFPVTFAFARERVPYDRGSADDMDGLVRQGDELPRRASARGAFNKLGFVLRPSRRMAIAELICGESLELAPVSLERRVAERFHGLRHGRLVAGLRHDRCRAQQCHHNGREYEYPHHTPLSSVHNSEDVSMVLAGSVVARRTLSYLTSVRWVNSLPTYNCV
jgi:hypothetical protein